MSADAKVWAETHNDWTWWRGLHDGDCRHTRQHEEMRLGQLLQDIEACLGGPCEWQLRQYPKTLPPSVGLVGYRR